MHGALTRSSGFERMEVINSVQRRRGWSLDEKIRAVEESSVPGMTAPPNGAVLRSGLRPSAHARRRSSPSTCPTEAQHSFPAHAPETPPAQPIPHGNSSKNARNFAH